MAFADRTLFFSGRSGTPQAITATAISEDVISGLFDTGATLHNQSTALDHNVEPATVPIVIQVTTTFATNTSLTVTLESDSAAGLDSSPTVHWTSGAIAVASLVAGYHFLIDYLPAVTNYGAFIGLRYTIGGSNATAGAIYAAIHDRTTNNLWV